MPGYTKVVLSFDRALWRHSGPSATVDGKREDFLAGALLRRPGSVESRVRKGYAEILTGKPGRGCDRPSWMSDQPSL